MKYDVILQAVVNVKVSGIEAESQKDAILAAQEKVDIWGLFKRDDPAPGVAYTEWSEGYADFLVDEEGDPEHERSQWWTENSGELEPV